MTSQAVRYTTLMHVQWAFALACAYLVLFNENAVWTLSGALLIVGLFGLNLVLGRLEPAWLTSSVFTIGLALVDIVLVAACLFVADQLTIEIGLLCLGVIVLSIAGLRIGTIAVVTLAMMVLYLITVWMTGSETFLKSSVLLRVPLLFTSAIVFAWLVEAGSSSTQTLEEVSSPVAEMDGKLDAQLAAIRRAQDALNEGVSGEAIAALEEVLEHNRGIQMRLRAILS